jgi:hypothetical protein
MNEPSETPVDNSFVSVLQLHRGGEALNELGQALRTITDAAQLTGKPGGITLKIIIAPTSSGAVEIMDSVKLTLPKADKISSLFFVGENGVLLRNNPAQLEMPLRSIEGGVTADLTNLRQVGQ